MTEKSIFSKLDNIDRRILWLIFIAFCSIPVFYPLGLPITVTKPTLDLVNAIKALPDGSKIFFEDDYTPLGHQEVTPECIAIVRLLISKKMYIVFASFYTPEAALWPPYIFNVALSKEVEAANYKYGVNYAFLGFIPGGDTSVSAFCLKIRQVANVDYYGTPLDQLPIMNNFEKIQDFNFCVTSGSTGLAGMLSQMQAPYKMPMVILCMGNDYSNMVRYYQAGAIKGLTSGLRGAAEIEMALNTPGEGMSSMDIVQGGFLLLVTFIIIGNISYFVAKYRSKPLQEGNKR